MTGDNHDSGEGDETVRYQLPPSATGERHDYAEIAPKPAATARKRKPAATQRTARGARLVDVAERDPAAERRTALEGAYTSYATADDEAWADYITESRAAWDRYQQRLKGACADYGSQVERIRAQP